ISGILIGVVGSVYFWGVPLIQKNKDISILESSEAFVRGLDVKIKSVANNGGRDQMSIPVPGIVTFDGKMITMSIETDGTIYAANAQIPLGRNTDSTLNVDLTNPSNPVKYGIWGTHEATLLNVISRKQGDTGYKNDYTLEYVELRNAATLRDFRIALTGPPASGGQDKTIIIDSLGDSTTVNNGRTLISSNVKISII
ncbi:MAG TPA: hypothetical protein VJH04_00530, partial [archaeon]|nr:hypothetical protein [archaeon]